MRRGAADDVAVALVELQLRRAGNAGHRLVDERLHRLHLRRVPEAVVDGLGELLRHAVAEPQHLAVHRDRLDGAQSRVEQRAARGLVDASRLHTDEAVLDDVDPAHAVAPGDLVESLEHGGGAKRLAVQRYRPTVLEPDRDLLGRIRSVLRVAGQREDVLGRLRPGVLEDSALVRAVEQVAVAAIRLLWVCVDHDPVRLRVGNQVCPPFEVPAPPRSEHLHARLEGVVGELEAHLIVALAGGAVGDGVGTFLLHDAELVLGDHRPGQRCPEKILTLVDSVGTHGREDEVGDELVAEVERPHGRSSGGARLAFDLWQVFGLADVGDVGHDLAAIRLRDPVQHDRSVEPARIGEHDLLWWDGLHWVGPLADFLSSVRSGWRMPAVPGSASWAGSFRPAR